MSNSVRVAYLPLVDACILIAAKELGSAADQGIDLVLERETSWANVRDRIAIGHVDAAHMLAPMPIAANLRLTPFDTEVIAPMALGLGGNAITISQTLRQEAGFSEAVTAPGEAGATLRRAVANGGERKLRIGVVHRHSAHNLELRYWLAASGVDPDRDCEIVILPPPLMPDALAKDQVDAFCVGEPWNSVAVSTGAGAILTTKNLIWASSPEKVLGVHSEWARKNDGLLKALVRSLYGAAKWCSDPANADALQKMLAQPRYLGIDETVVAQALSGPAGYEPFDRAATFPWQSHAMWFYTQMVRWGMVEHTAPGLDLARRTYRPDLYRDALREFDAVVPSSSMKVEGALTSSVPVGAIGGELVLGPDGFFDGKVFDPDKVEDYLKSQARGA
ncbi:MAG: ABC transporter substrate-binding protein [Roseitalea sp.]|jgi:NitT/TauT family transport system ATP-binding protein|nr:ABC transporter substrate-binding protein [Roseitalea sp.]MBO6721191.1 ABC transporter substrate-binding protein [Roseitalea sp.]MBO6744249.1 ABC transporter substrate-binding protein [Roseitalea sp.]